jgi:hypothetical protein
MRILACFTAIGALMGIALPLPAFAMLLVVIMFAYAVVAGDDLTLVGRVYAVVLAAVALQIGYFLAVLARVQVYRKLSARRASSSREEGDGRR